MAILALLLLLGFIATANWLAVRGSPALRRLFDVLLFMLNLPALGLGLGLVFLPADLLTAMAPGLAAAGANLQFAGLALVLAAAWGFLAALAPVRQALARGLPLDPVSPVHALALVLAGYLAGNSLFTLSQGGLDGLSESAQAVSIGALVLQQLVFVLLALAGTGLGMRRHWREVGRRLGLERPTARQLRVAALWVLLLVALQTVFGIVWGLLSPQQAETIEELNGLLLADIDTWWKWLVLAISAGVGEELLFRGALQPVFGIGPTALLFALAHIQYGLTAVNLFVLFLGVVFGLIRRRHNTTTAVLLHSGYNFVLGLLALLAPHLERVAA